MATKKAAKKTVKKAAKKTVKKAAKKKFEGQVYGEFHGRVRLTEKTVIKLRARAEKHRAKGERPPVHLWAEEFNVAPSTISMAINGKTWSYL